MGSAIMNGVGLARSAVLARTEATPSKIGEERAAGAFQVTSRWLVVETAQATEFVDLTDEVERAVAESGIRNGTVTVYSAHTTAGIVVNEGEPLLMEDMARTLERVAPRGAYYRHDDMTERVVNLEPNERANGHSHCQRLFVGASETIPIVGGMLAMGRWQRIFFLELDGPRPRQIVVQVMGV